MPVLKFHTRNGDKITLQTSPDSTIIARGPEQSYTFDYSGRLMSAARGGKLYRRSLANEIIEKRVERRSGMERVRRALAPAQVQKLEIEAYDFAGRVSGAIREEHPKWEPEALEAAQTALAHVTAYCYTGLERERASLAQIYHPVTVLPPDHSPWLYLQMTEGCPDRQCTFCHFLSQAHPKDLRRFRIKPPNVFREHIRRVRAFLGEGLRLRRSIFLGDANALLIPHNMLLARLDIVNQEFALSPQEGSSETPAQFDGIYSFIDSFAQQTKSAEEFAELRARGLKRLYVGVVSGDAELLKLSGEHGSLDDIVRCVEQCKAGGVAVGVIVPIGVGGEAFERDHVEHTAQLIAALPLDEHDLIYLSEPASHPGAAEGTLPLPRGGTALTRPQLDEQMEILRETLLYASPARVSCYDVREFVY